MAAIRHLRFLKVRNISCWSGVLFIIMCVRTQKNVVRAIRYQFKLSYVRAAHDDRILFIERLPHW